VVLYYIMPLKAARQPKAAKPPKPTASDFLATCIAVEKQVNGLTRDQILLKHMDTTILCLADMFDGRNEAIIHPHLSGLRHDMRAFNDMCKATGKVDPFHYSEFVKCGHKLLSIFMINSIGEIGNLFFNNVPILTEPQIEKIFNIDFTVFTAGVLGSTDRSKEPDGVCCLETREKAIEAIMSRFPGFQYKKNKFTAVPMLTLSRAYYREKAGLILAHKAIAKYLSDSSDLGLAQPHHDFNLRLLKSMGINISTQADGIQYVDHRTLDGVIRYPLSEYNGLLLLNSNEKIKDFVQIAYPVTNMGALKKDAGRHGRVFGEEGWGASCCNGLAGTVSLNALNITLGYSGFNSTLGNVTDSHLPNEMSKKLSTLDFFMELHVTTTIPYHELIDMCGEFTECYLSFKPLHRPAAAPPLSLAAALPLDPVEPAKAIELAAGARNAAARGRMRAHGLLPKGTFGGSLKKVIHNKRVTIRKNKPKYFTHKFLRDRKNKNKVKKYYTMKRVIGGANLNEEGNVEDQVNDGVEELDDEKHFDITVPNLKPDGYVNPLFMMIVDAAKSAYLTEAGKKSSEQLKQKTSNRTTQATVVSGGVSISSQTLKPFYRDTPYILLSPSGQVMQDFFDSKLFKDMVFDLKKIQITSRDIQKARMYVKRSRIQKIRQEQTDLFQPFVEKILKEYEETGERLLFNALLGTLRLQFLGEEAAEFILCMADCSLKANPLLDNSGIGSKHHIRLLKCIPEHLFKEINEDELELRELKKLVRQKRNFCDLLSSIFIQVGNIYKEDMVDELRTPYAFTEILIKSFCDVKTFPTSFTEVCKLNYDGEKFFHLESVNFPDLTQQIYEQALKEEVDEAKEELEVELEEEEELLEVEEELLEEEEEAEEEVLEAEAEEPRKSSKRSSTNEPQEEASSVKKTTSIKAIKKLALEAHNLLTSLNERSFKKLRKAKLLFMIGPNKLYFLDKDGRKKVRESIYYWVFIRKYGEMLKSDTLVETGYSTTNTEQNTVYKFSYQLLLSYFYPEELFKYLDIDEDGVVSRPEFNLSALSELLKHRFILASQEHAL